MSNEIVGELDGIPIYVNKYGEAPNLPERREDTIYIVSKMICEAYPERDDFYIVANVNRTRFGSIN